MKAQTSDSHRAARQSRKAMTDAEGRLWQNLRREQLGATFRRQHPLEHYVLDFVCLERRLVIKVDGGQHAQAKGHDEERSRQLTAAGFSVLGFWNNEVGNELNAVIEAIWHFLNPSPP